MSKFFSAIFWAIGAVSALGICGVVITWLVTVVVVYAMAPFYLFEMMRHTWP